MRILGAIGLGMTIVVLRLLVPEVYAGLEGALVQFFETAQVLLAHAETVISTGSGF